MYQEGSVPESGKGFWSLKEIDDRLDVLGEIIDTFGKDSLKGQNALMERAGLLQERSTAEQAEQKKKVTSLQERGQSVPVLTLPEKALLQRREDLNQVLAKEMSDLIQWSMMRPDVKPVLQRLRDPKSVERFLGDQIGIEFFTQDLKRDLKSLQVVQAALERLYQAGTGRNYYEEAA